MKPNYFRISASFHVLCVATGQNLYVLPENLPGIPQRENSETRTFRVLMNRNQPGVYISRIGMDGSANKCSIQEILFVERFMEREASRVLEFEDPFHLIRDFSEYESEESPEDRNFDLSENEEIETF